MTNIVKPCFFTNIVKPFPIALCKKLIKNQFYLKNRRKSAIQKPITFKNSE